MDNKSERTPVINNKYNLSGLIPLNKSSVYKIHMYINQSENYVFKRNIFLLKKFRSFLKIELGNMTKAT